MLALSPIVIAQAQEQEKSIHGAFGQFFIGPVMLPSQILTNYLNQADVLGKTYDPIFFGYTIGGEMVGMFDKFYIGFGGFGVIKPLSSSSVGSAKTNISGGYFKLGYRYYSTTNSLMHVYAGFGGMSYSLDLLNLSDTAQIRFNRKNPLLPGKRECFTVSGFLFDLGTGIKTFVVSESDETKKSRGGLLVGIDAGCFITIPMSGWNQSRVVVSGPPDLLPMVCPYLRVSIGGGGFR